ncbi:Hint domain-containing protein [Pseudopelagicola sp. nBUS_20]|uniref:Hint domain-containing protein n=1 Tax=Pseudopelagicola sp. nBUS_20 TaxID=3395317 RepID=UPI003EBBBAA3
MADPKGPGVVDGTENDDDMGINFTDSEGDAITSGDDTISADDGNDSVEAGFGSDTVYGGMGNDTLRGGRDDDQMFGDVVGSYDGAGIPGDDLIAGEGGSDTIEGMDGNDTIYGGYEPASAPTPTPGGIQSFNWSEVGSPSDGDPLTSPFVQDTGSVLVTYTSTSDASSENNFEDETQLLDDIDPGDEIVDANSALRAITGSGQNVTASQSLEFSELVENVQFRINDIDEHSVVKVRAWDADGNPLEVVLTAEDITNLKLVDIDGVTGNEAAISQDCDPGDSTTEANSVFVAIPGPVAKFEIRLVNLSEDPADVTITDIFFVGGPSVVPEDGADVLTGGGGADLIYGQDGGDLLTGGEGMDTLLGGGDADTILGATNLDFVYGGEEGDDNDTLDLRGLGPVSIVYTDSDSEEGVVVIRETGAAIAFSEIENILFDEEVPRDGIVEGTFNSDVIDINYSGDPDGDFVDNDDAILPGQVGDDDIIVAGEGDDTVIAALDNDLVFAGDGNDIVDSSFGADTLFGQDGDDYLDGREDDDYLRGGEGNDTIFGGDGADSVEGDEGDDSIATGSGNDTASGNAGNDYIDAFTGNDIVSGNAGNDTLLGNDGDDTVRGGEGDDAISGGEGDDRLFGGAGNDTIFAGAGNDIAEGGEGDDRLVSGGGDTLLGGDDQDTFYATISDDIVGGEGGIDNDTLLVNGPAEVEYVGGDPASEAGIVYFLDSLGSRTGQTLTFAEIETVVISDPQGDGIIDGTDSADLIDASYLGDPQGDQIDNFDGFDNITKTALFSETPNFFVSAPGGPYNNSNDDAVLAGAGDDTVIGGSGDDVIYGGEGDDVLDGGFGRDDLIGGEGDDRMLNTAGVSRMFGGEGNDTFEGGIQSDLMYGDTGNDVFMGNKGNDIISGGEGDDTIDGGLGGDTISGGEGNDSILGGLGDDEITTGGGNNFVDAGLGDNKIIAGEGNDSLVGGIGDDEIDGGGGNDTIDGGGGNDDIAGGIGDDLMIGGFGADTLDGGDGNDAITGGTPGVTGLASVGQTPDTIVGGDGSDIVNGDSGDDLLFGDNPDGTGSGDDTIGGGIGADQIIGGAGDDIIYGEETVSLVTGGVLARPSDFDAALALEPGDDTLEGGVGNDTLFGQEGDDRVSGGTGDDRITGGVGNDTLNGDDDADTFFVNSADEGIGDSIFGGSGGNDQDTLDLFGVQGIDWRLTNVTQDIDGNGLDGTVEFLDSAGVVTGSMSFENIEAGIPCFTPGTKILTPLGEVCVEKLQPGDSIVTRDNGLQEIRWAGKRHVSGQELLIRPNLRPILIKQGAIGPNQPERDMMVSPNHRMLLVSQQAELLFEEREVLIAAKHLTHLDGIHVVETVGVEYIHIMCDNHEVVLADGAWSESFQPGEQSINGICNEQRQEIYELFPELRERDGLESYTSARYTLKRHEAQLIT